MPRGRVDPVFRVVADVWEKDVWEFQAKSGRSGFCCLFLHFLGKFAFQKMSGRTPEVPDILLPDIRGLLSFGEGAREPRNFCKRVVSEHLFVGNTFVSGESMLHNDSTSSKRRVPKTTTHKNPLLAHLHNTTTQCSGCLTLSLSL